MKQSVHEKNIMKDVFGAMKPRRRLKRTTATKMKRLLLAMMSVVVLLFIFALTSLFNQTPKTHTTSEPFLLYWRPEDVFRSNQGRELLFLRRWKTAKERNVSFPSGGIVPTEAKGVHAQRYVPVAADEILREQEAYITFDAYIACLEKVLHVDVNSKQELPWEKDDLALPYVLLPVNVELSDVKATMCSLDVHVRHLLYVVEGASPTTTAFFDDVVRAFGFTQRLKVHHVPGLLGYANMVNAGLLDAMKQSREEVPFFTVLSHSVRIPAATLRASLESFYNASTADAVLRDTLQKDVASEPNTHTPVRFPCALRGVTNETLVSTSLLLPDSIRYLPIFQLHERFNAFDGLLLFETLEAFQFDVYAITRFAMETVGFMDENILNPQAVVRDWDDRRFSLGLRVRSPLGGAVSTLPPLKRWEEARKVLSDKFDLSPSSFTEAQTWAKVLSHLDLVLLDYAYMKRKYGDVRDDELRAPYINTPTIPVDAWVLDLSRRLNWYALVRSTKEFFFDKRTPHEAKSSVNRAFSWMPADVWNQQTGGMIFDVMGVPLQLLMTGVFQDGKLTPAQWKVETTTRTPQSAEEEAAKDETAV